VIRVYIIAGLSVALCAALVAFTVQRGALIRSEEALRNARAYIEQTGDIRDVKDGLPTDPDAVLDGLSRFIR
jgi:hypothetical protein